MSTHVDIKPVTPWLADWLADLDELGAAGDFIERGPEHVRHLLLHVVSDFPLDILAGVPLPAGRADKAILGFSVVRTLERHLALCALRYADRIHGSP